MNDVVENALEYIAACSDHLEPDEYLTFLELLTDRLVEILQIAGEAD